MKSLIRNIFFLILISSGFSSCVYDKYEDSEIEQSKIDPNTTVLYLELRALNPSAISTPVEKIKSVRVIILGNETKEADTDDPAGTGTVEVTTVECNRLYELPVSNVSGFSYTLTWPSKLGKKSVYVIANEESVGDDLTTKLNLYTEESDAGDLVDWLEDYTFEPEYDSTGSTIFLPYTFSKTDFIPVPREVNEVNCWLVPVATKFVFHFQNNRSTPVRINSISMAYANSGNYIFPHIAESQQYMEYGDKTLYWPDWLAAVSQASWNHPEYGDNEWFNGQYGWITAYSVPDQTDAEVYEFIADGSAEAFTIPGTREVTDDEGNTETEASTHTTRVYYLPESINYQDPEKPALDPDAEIPEGTDQVYYLTIDIQDLGPVGKAPKFVNVPIPNLNALFRNTFVVIQMNMNQGDIKIYAEIAPWNKVTSNGWVSEGDNAPSNNPFAIRKK